MLDDCEAEARAARRPRRVGAVEALEETRQVVGIDAETAGKLNVYLKKHLGEKFSVRKRPTKTDSADLHVGDEFVGVVFADVRGRVAYHADILEPTTSEWPET